jgi:predicted HAD superfamily Cof-like phosphohydrolase
MALEEAREIREALEESLPLHSLLREIVDYTYVSLGHLVTCGLLPVWVEPEPRPVAHPVELTDAVKVGLAFLFESNAEQVARALRLRHLPSLHWSAITGAFLGFRTFALLGLPERPFFIEVHEANMRKVRNPGGLRPVKPVGWRAPDLEAVLRNLSLK